LLASSLRFTAASPFSDKKLQITPPFSSPSSLSLSFPLFGGSLLLWHRQSAGGGNLVSNLVCSSDAGASAGLPVDHRGRITEPPQATCNMLTMAASFRHLYKRSIPRNCAGCSLPGQSPCHRHFFCSRKKGGQPPSSSLPLCVSLSCCGPYDSSL
jgi:hypothetical protein